MHKQEFLLWKDILLIRFPLPVRADNEVPAVLLINAVLPSESATDSSDTWSVQEHDLATTNYPEEVPKLLEVLNCARSKAVLDGESIGLTPLISHRIPLYRVTKPIYVPAQHLLHAQQVFAEELIVRMLHEGVIDEFNSSWNAPLVLVPKMILGILLLITGDSMLA